MTKPQKFFDIFTPPKGYLGNFGWVCGFTAEARVMREALDRFTQGSGAHQATYRRPGLFLITDQASPQIRAAEVVGLHHMTLGPAWTTRFKGRGLFHAKVALLHFSQEPDPSRKKAQKQRLRLVVSTGNWSLETLERNIDLFWQVEVECDAFLRDADGDPQALADVFAAYQMFQALRPCLSPNPWAAASAQGGLVPDATFDWVFDGMEGRDLPQARFFHSLDAPLWHPLAARIQAEKRPGLKSDILVMGSGFYAGGDPAREAEAAPKGAEGFLLKLAEALAPDVKGKNTMLVLNPAASQGLAASTRALETQGWQFFAPRFPEKNASGLGKIHAKFIYRGRADRLGGWLYLGSGNLTPAGLGSGPRAKQWNFEAGVVLPVAHAHPPERFLPMDPGAPLDLHSIKLAAGDPFSVTAEFANDCPLTHFTLVEGEGSWLEPAPLGATHAGVEALYPDGTWQGLGAGIALAQTARPPSEVRLRWKTTGGDPVQISLPVLYPSGAVLLPALHQRRIEDVLEALAMIAATGREVEPEPEDATGEQAAFGDGSQPQRSTGVEGNAYVSRRLMKLVTGLGEVQAGLRPDEARLWSARLEGYVHSLRQAEGEVVTLLARMRLNPFAHLGRPEFMPLGLTESEAMAIRAAHGKAAALWGLGDFPGFGGGQEP